MNTQTIARDKAQISSHTNLKHLLSSFIGRKKELAQVHQLLTQTRLLTLMGVGGCGKTRLARQVTTELVSTQSFDDGVWLVELAALNDPALVPLEVAQTLGVRETFDQPVIESLIDYLAQKHLLLVLDNCEHLLIACTQFAEKLLVASPQLRILATSREPLGLPGETTFLVPSLSLPDTVSSLLPSDLAEYDASALFLERAKSVLPNLMPTEQNMAAILQICRRLDGIPLAIELAAARVNVLTAEQIAARLDDRFTLLTASNRTAVLPRHQTLRATIDWSYDLLSEKERILFRRLAVFAGGFTLDALESICAGDELAQSEILDGLARLVSKSLVVAEILEQREARYHLLETIRQYASMLLRESGEENKLRDRHLDWYVVLSEEAKAQWRGPRQKELFDQLEIEHDNLRAALEWSKLESGSTEKGLRLGSALWRFWEIHNHSREGRQHLTTLLALPGAQIHTSARARALYGAGYLAMMQGTEKSFTTSEAFMNESMAIARELGEPQLIANGIYGSGILALYRGDNEQAIKQLEESLTLFRQLGDCVGTYVSLYNLAEAATARRDYGQAQKLHEESLMLKREQGDEWSIANSLMSLAIIARLQENYQQAIDLIQQGLGLFQKIGDRTDVAFCLLEFSAIAAIQGQSQLAVQLYAVADMLLEGLGFPSGHAYRAKSERQLASIRLRMGEARFKAAWEMGRALTLDQAIEQARGLKSLLENQTDSQTSTERGAKDETVLVPLNERELEVLGLIAEGLSNHEIAERLMIALSTVKWHINNLFGKLGVHSRTQAVAQAKELGLL
jgi:predicted ATPase/DNA-binding CsgD family transcriptional regulator